MEMIMKNRCPFLEEVSMVFCNACKARKMLPKDQLIRQNSCEANFDKCAIYREFISHRSKEESMDMDVDRNGAKSEPAKPCIWMKAGVIAHRLCTRDYDCKNCEFDQAIMAQGGTGTEAPMVVQAIEKLRQLPAAQRKCRYMLTGDFSYKICPNNYECWHCVVDQYIQDTIDANPYLQKRRKRMMRKTTQVKGFTFRDDLYYLPNHIWIAIEGETAKVGIDDFAARLIGSIEHINFTRNKAIAKGTACWRIGKGPRLLEMSMPIEGEIVARNEVAEATPSIVQEDPYNQGWLLKIKPARDIGDLMKGDRAREWLEQEFDRLHQEIEIGVGIAISDGGELVANVNERLADDEWHKLVDRFLK